MNRDFLTAFELFSLVNVSSFNSIHPSDRTPTLIEKSCQLSDIWKTNVGERIYKKAAMQQKEISNRNFQRKENFSLNHITVIQ